jgi:hypothetical protein
MPRPSAAGGCGGLARPAAGNEECITRVRSAQCRSGSRPITRRIDHSMPLPSGPQKPRLGPHHGQVGIGRWDNTFGRRRPRPSTKERLPAQAVEVPRRRAWIDARPAAVLDPVRDDVHERIAHFARRPKRVYVVTVRPDATTAAEQAVDAARDAHGKALHAPREERTIVRLDEQVNVVRLHAEMNNAKEPLLRGSNLCQHAAEHRLRSKRWQPLTDAHRHVQGMAAVVFRTPAMRNAGTSSLGLATRAAPPASGRAFERQAELSATTSHVI